MIRLGIFSLTITLAFAFGRLPLQAQPPPSSAPDFREVYDLVREHLAGATDAELNRAAVQGLLSTLGPKVTLLPGGTNDPATADAPLISRSAPFDGKIVYLRIARVQDGLPKALTNALANVSGTNDLNGLVLDLRFAAGDDYSAAAATADLFLKKERPLLDWGQGMVQSKPKDDALALPIATLVNHHTAGAAEALAAVLREAGSSLLLGSQTAGQAMIAQDYPLKDGQRLRIASGPVHLGDGSTLSSDGLKPDIQVAVAAAAEQTYYADAYTELLKTNPSPGPAGLLTNALSGTNRTRRPRFNEAELVRERKTGAILDPDLDPANAEPEKPLVRDPALARALDVLKGLALVRPSRS